MFVATGPGATRLKRIPCPAYMYEQLLVIPTTACLEAL